MLVCGRVQRAGMARRRRASKPTRVPLEPTATPIGMGLLGARVDDRDQIARATCSSFEIISVHLLVVLIGAAYLARARRRSEHDRRMTPLMLANLSTC